MQIGPRSLQTNQSLCHLDVSGTELGDTGFAQLCTIFETNTTLCRLFVCGNELKTIEPLAKVLHSNPNSGLTPLYAHGNQRGDAGGVQMGGLPSGTSLCALYLDHVGMGAAGVAALLAHPSFTVVSLRELDLRGDTASAMEAALANMSPQFQHVSMSIFCGPEGVESDDDDDDDDDEEDDDNYHMILDDNSTDAQRRTPKGTHNRTRVLNKMLLERGLHLQSLSLNSRWFRVDPKVVQFVLQRNKSRDAVTDTRSLLPHALSQAQLSAAFWLLRRDPAAWSSAAATAASSTTTCGGGVEDCAPAAATLATERPERRARKRQRTTR